MKYFYIVLLLVSIGKYTSAQNKPELPFVINSAGGYGVVNGQMHDFSLGEMVLVQTFDGVPNFLFSQGFLQPFFIAPPVAKDVVVNNNVITPNNDGKNDFFTIEGLDNYPGSKVSIFDRAGRVVFSATNYKNNFDGRYNGSILNEDAYYYVIELGKGLGLIRGSISIVLDFK